MWWRPGSIAVVMALAAACTSTAGHAGAGARAGARSGISSAATSGTIGPLPRMLVGGGPFAVALDSVTHTAYVANQSANDLSVINTRSCNARDTAGCGQVPVTVAAGNGPAALAVDQATGTVYVTSGGISFSGTGDQLAVINAATCNSKTTSGCGQTRPP